MDKLKVMTIVGTRPELIRLSSVIKLFDQCTEHLLVHTGQNSAPELFDVFLEDLDIRPPDLYLAVENSSVGNVIGQTIVRTEQAIREFQPDAVLILGDTNSAMAAIVAERLEVPVYHMEAGNRSFDLNVPEEINRRLVDHVASFNLPYNGYSMRNLLNEGIHPRRICVTGSPMNEILHKYLVQIDESKILVKQGLKPQTYLLASIHRQENVDDHLRLREIVDYLASLNEHFGLEVVLSTHPRTSKRLEELNYTLPHGVTSLPPFGFFDYCKLQLNAKLVISDSGTISEESSILGFPAVTLRKSMERPEALEAGTIRIVNPGHDLAELNVYLDNFSTPKSLPEGYGNRDFSARVLNFVLSTAHLHRNWLGLAENKSRPN